LDGLVYLRHFVADGLFRVQKPIDRELSGVQLRIVPHLFGHFRLHVLFFSNVRSVQYVAPPFPNHPKKKRETQNKKQNGKDIEDHLSPDAMSQSLV
jgi:hypothetical protein